MFHLTCSGVLDPPLNIVSFKVPVSSHNSSIEFWLMFYSQESTVSIMMLQNL